MTAKQKQCLLAYLGYYQADIDGIWGPKSQEAARAFLESTQAAAASFEKALLAAICDGKEGIWGDLRYFSRAEFACRCGKCGGFPVEMDPGLLRRADDLRGMLGSAIHVSSGVRCNPHNVAVGGVANSRHLLGKAMDFRAEGFTAAQILAQVKKLPNIRYAYAIDNQYVHMDVE